MIEHQQQIIDFKVTLYKFSFKGKKSSKSSGEIPFDILTNYDTTSRKFREVAKKLSSTKNDKLFKAFLKDLYAEFDAVIKGKSAEDLIGSGHFIEKDITHLVTNWNSTISLTPPNSASVTLVDTSSADTPAGQSGSLSTSRFTDVFPEPLAYKGEGGVGAALFKDIGLDQILEFDLIRIWSFSRRGVNIQDKLDSITGFKNGIDQQIRFPGLRKNRLVAAPKRIRGGVLVQPNPEGVDKNGIDIANRFIYSPVFTGFVSGRTLSQNPSGVGTLSLSLISIDRVFSQSVVTFSGAISDKLLNSSSTLRANLKDVKALYSNYSDKDPDQIIDTLFQAYLGSKPIFENVSTGGSAKRKKIKIHIPSLSAIRKRFRATSKSELGNTQIMPMFVAVLLYHLVKKKYREPILIYDDRFPSLEEYAHARPLISGQSSMSGTRIGANPENLLQPYMLLLRTSFSNFYQSDYNEPEKIFQEIRNTSYMELFEDRAGTFHFRFPQYNRRLILHNIRDDEVISVDLSLDDASMYSMEMSRPIIPILGANTIRPPSVYIDLLSILKYGTRMPKITTNPNSITSDFATFFAEFHNSYMTFLESRRATIVRVGDPSIQPGDMVSFSRSPHFKSRNQIGFGEDIHGYQGYVGYVMSVSDNLDVSGSYSQTLELSFVREAAISTKLPSPFSVKVVEEIAEGSAPAAASIALDPEVIAARNEYIQNVLVASKTVSATAPLWFFANNNNFKMNVGSKYGSVVDKTFLEDSKELNDSSSDWMFTGSLEARGSKTGSKNTLEFRTPAVADFLGVMSGEDLAMFSGNESVQRQQQALLEADGLRFKIEETRNMIEATKRNITLRKIDLVVDTAYIAALGSILRILKGFKDRFGGIFSKLNFKKIILGNDSPVDLAVQKRLSESIDKILDRVRFVQPIRFRTKHAEDIPKMEVHLGKTFDLYLKDLDGNSGFFLRPKASLVWNTLWNNPDPPAKKKKSAKPPSKSGDTNLDSPKDQDGQISGYLGPSISQYVRMMEDFIIFTNREIGDIEQNLVRIKSDIISSANVVEAEFLKLKNQQDRQIAIDAKLASRLKKDKPKLQSEGKFNVNDTFKAQ